MVAEEGSNNLLDILIVASVPYQEKMEMLGNTFNMHREKNKRHADAVVSFLRALPAKVAGSNYQIAIMNMDCIRVC